jgi:hypothetical protein
MIAEGMDESSENCDSPEIGFCIVCPCSAGATGELFIPAPKTEENPPFI